ncbi:MAG: tRNA (N6-threonylcarbamoyladenosine(37)-N6)-methyltransferase TrmO [Candidatus Hadarchaeum sp.]|uniref:tRNA (N6-threonylcarbamoyladenosine(37)-N6)-methyltransferase TrmO n=1 Tax=Candidatus Hadarchaeum sp. TaxID=2883567 RepID=UPI003D0D439A
MKGELRFVGAVDRVEGEETEIVIYPEFCPALKGIENYSHLIVLYWFHQRDTPEERRVLQVIPKRHPGAPLVGVFASRSPTRPNPIGMCVVELIKVEDCRLRVKGMDAAEGSPIVDIKPYLPRADSIPGAKAPDWMAHGPST